MLFIYFYSEMFRIPKQIMEIKDLFFDKKSCQNVETNNGNQGFVFDKKVSEG